MNEPNHPDPDREEPDRDEPTQDEGATPPNDALADAEAIIEDAIVRDTAAEVEPDPAATADVPGADPLEADEAGAGDALTQAESKAAEHLADLQRLQAEYVNYRKRVDRDRAATGELASARFIESLIPVLDDIAAAREHGDLTDGPFAAIADKLEETLRRAGWARYAQPGDVFDPAVHEALMSQPSSEVSEPTVTQVAQPGHRVGDKVVRPARVIVAQPE